MFTYNLSDEDKALITCFNNSANSIGMDADFSLNPTDRGVLEVSGLAKKFTLLRAIQKLNLKGQAAKEFAWKLNSVDIPLSESEVDATLKEIFNAQ